MESQVATIAVQENMALDQALLAPSSAARRVQKDGFKILQGALLASKSNQATLSGKDAAHRFKFLWDPKFVTMALVALIKSLRLKHARQDSTARIHLRTSVWSARSDIRARKQRRNVRLATKESSILTQAVHAQNAPQDSSKIKAPSQVLRAKIAQQDTTAPSQAPRPAPILVA